MIHVYKSGGAWKTESGIEYEIKAIPAEALSDYLKQGWMSSLDDIKPAKKATKKPKDASE